MIVQNGLINGMKVKLILFSTFLALSQSFSIMETAYAFDSNPPIVLAVTSSPISLTDSGGSVHVTLTISSTNGLSGSAVVQFWLVSNPARIMGFQTLTLNSGDQYRGTWSGNVVIPSNQLPGKYQLTVFPLHDLSGNSTSFLGTESYLNYGTVVPVVVPTASSGASSKPSPSSSPTGATYTDNRDNRILALTDMLSKANQKILDISINLEIARNSAKGSVVQIQLLRKCLAFAKTLINAKKGALPKSCSSL